MIGCDRSSGGLEAVKRSNGWPTDTLWERAEDQRTRGPDQNGVAVLGQVGIARNMEGGKDCKDNAEITDWSGKAE